MTCNNVELVCCIVITWAIKSGIETEAGGASGPVAWDWVTGEKIDGASFAWFQEKNPVNLKYSLSSLTTITSSNDRSYEDNSSTEDNSPSAASSTGELQLVKAVKSIVVASYKEESLARNFSPNEDSNFKERMGKALMARSYATQKKKMQKLAGPQLL